MDSFKAVFAAAWAGARALVLSAVLLGCFHGQAGGSNPHAVEFGGVDGYVELTPDGRGTFDNESFTVEAWANFRDFSKEMIVWSYDYLEHRQPYHAQHVMVHGNGAVYFLWNDGHRFRYIQTEVGLIEPDMWYHIACTYTPGSQKIYVNGIEKASGGYEPRDWHLYPLTITYYEKPVWIGKANFMVTRRFAVDEVRAWDRARSQEQIKADMNRKLTGGEGGLVGYWRFDEGKGTTAADSSPNNNNGVIHGGVSWVRGEVKHE